MNKKKRRGRPLLPKGKHRTIFIGARLDQDFVTKLDRYSSRVGFPRSAVLRLALKAYLDQEKARMAA